MQCAALLVERKQRSFVQQRQNSVQGGLLPNGGAHRKHMCKLALLLMLDVYQALQLYKHTIEDAHGSGSAPNEQTLFTPMPFVVGLNGTVYGSLDTCIASVPPKNRQVLSDERSSASYAFLRATYQKQTTRS